MRILKLLCILLVPLIAFSDPVPTESIQRSIGTNTIFGSSSRTPFQVNLAGDLQAVNVSNVGNGQVASILGYTVLGDGGGGQFTYSPSSVDPDDGGISVLAPNAGSGRWLRISNLYLTPTAGTGLLFSSNQFSVNPTQSLTSLTVTNPISASLQGNADTASKLATARTINGVSFDGSGNVTVPAAAGTLTGSTIASGVTASSLTSVGAGTIGTMAIQNSTSISATGGTLNGVTVTGLPAPSANSDAVRLIDLNSVSSGITQRTSVAVATTANITLSGEQTIDGVLTSASRILVKNQTLTQNNGIYVTAAGAWSRASDSNTAAQLKVGYYYFVSAGTTQGSTGWSIQTAPTTLGTDPVVFAQFSASSSYTNGTGLGLSGNVFSVNAAQPGVTSVGTLTGLTVSGHPTLEGVTSTGATGAGKFVFDNSPTLVTPNIGAASASSLSSSGQITSTVSTGTPPLVIASTTNVPNLNSSSLNGATFASPGSIGNASPGSGAFTGITINNTSILGLGGTGSANAGFVLNGGSGSGGGPYINLQRNSVTKAQIGTDSILSGGTSDDLDIISVGANISLRASSIQAALVTPTGIQGAIGTTTPNTGAFTTISGSVTTTGSVTSRTLANRFADAINAKDYGAVPNTGTDQTSSLQAWLNAATNDSKLFLPPGIYYHTGLSIPASKADVEIDGYGAKLYLTVNANNSLIIPSTCSYITLNGVWFDGVGTSRANGIHIRASADFTTINDCKFEHCSDWAIQVDNSVAVKGFVCTNSYFKDTLGDGCHVMNVDGFRIQHNTFWQCGDDAIAALAQSMTIQPLNGIISDNLIYGRTTAYAGSNTHGFRGIVVMIGKNIIIRNNLIYNTYASAIDINDEYNSSLLNEGITVEDNSCYGCNVNGGPLGAIQMYFAKKSTISKNHIFDPVNASAIAIATCSTVTISDNEISQSLNQFCRGIVNNNNASYIGRSITASNDVQILGNTFDLTQASNNEAIYMPFTTGARCNSLIVAGNTSRSTSTSYINTDWIITGKFVNNTTIGGTVAPSTGSNSTGITSANNN